MLGGRQDPSNDSILYLDGAVMKVDALSRYYKAVGGLWGNRVAASELFKAEIAIYPAERTA